MNLHLKDQNVTNDNELARAAQRGEQNAFRELVTRYENRIYRLGLKIVHDQQDAEDVLQETFISAYRHLDSFRGDAQFSTWLYRIATNAALMKLRARKPIASLDEPSPDGSEADMMPNLVDWSATPEEMLLNGEIRTQMDDALASLPEILRVVFVLRDVEGLSVEETARVLDISVPNVKTRLHRARLALRECLSLYFAERKAKVGKEVAR